MILMAVPLILLFELSILLSSLIVTRRKENELPAPEG
jgi:Sec-independent protein secretion pathway component TatC